MLKEDETCPEAATAHRSRGERERSTCPDATNVCQGEGEEDQQTRTPASDAGHRGARDDGSGQTSCYPRLPDAIAPSLASTPEFARRNSWCHAIEVKNSYNKSRYLTILLLVYTESALAVIIYMV